MNVSGKGEKNLCCGVRSSSWQQNPSEQGKSSRSHLLTLCYLSVSQNISLVLLTFCQDTSCDHCPASSPYVKCYHDAPQNHPLPRRLPAGKAFLQ